MLSIELKIYRPNCILSTQTTLKGKAWLMIAKASSIGLNRRKIFFDDAIAILNHY